jgi:lysophospholipase L1-like esterase
MTPIHGRLAALIAVLSLCHGATAQNATNQNAAAAANPKSEIRNPKSPTLPTIYVAGDSTAADGIDGARGWGRHLAKFFDPAKVRVENRALGGRSSRTFVTEGLWGDVASQLRAGDVVLIQFGHNDGGPINDRRRARGSLPGLGDDTREIDNEQTRQRETVHTFGWYMNKMIADARAHGATPILLSLTVRNIWTGDRVERGSGRNGAWARELARKENVPFIDLTNLIADEYEQLGLDSAAKLFPRDHTHTSDAGALANARLVVAGFKGLREEMWSPWLTVAGRTVPRAAPNYVKIPGVARGSDEQSQSRFLNTPYPADSSLPTLWLIGDSTVRTGRGRGELGQFGWGDPLENEFDQSRINVVNRAMGGTGARTYRTGGFWQPVLEQIQPGDVVLMQFGHNDNGERGALPGVGSETEERKQEDGTTETVETFGAYLRKFVQEIRDQGATPILCSLIPRKKWQDGTIQRSRNGHAAWAHQVAKDQHVPFIDLHERIAQRYDAMGPDAVEPMFADQGVHTSYAGAVLNAECVLEGLRSLPENPLQKFLLVEETQAAERQPAAAE